MTEEDVNEEFENIRSNVGWYGIYGFNRIWNENEEDRVATGFDLGTLDVFYGYRMYFSHCWSNDRAFVMRCAHPPKPTPPLIIARWYKGSWQ